MVEPFVQVIMIGLVILLVAELFVATWVNTALWAHFRVTDHWGHFSTLRNWWMGIYQQYACFSGFCTTNRCVVNLCYWQGLYKIVAVDGSSCEDPPLVWLNGWPIMLPTGFRMLSSCSITSSDYTPITRWVFMSSLERLWQWMGLHANAEWRSTFVKVLD